MLNLEILRGIVVLDREGRRDDRWLVPAGKSVSAVFIGIEGTKPAMGEPSRKRKSSRG